MSQVFVHGVGAVSPAGWGLPALRSALKSGVALPVKELARPGWAHPLRVRTVPPASPRPAFLANPRLRRTSAITHYAVAAALEALGPARSAELPLGPNHERLGIILCVMHGCVGYSRRFYDETLRDPATASPLVFPETVFNAPASHLSALLGAGGLNYTLVGDPGTFVQGLALAADWLASDQADACLVVGAEEVDWTTADAFHLFSRDIMLAEGAGAVCLRREPSAAAVSVELQLITESHLFVDAASRADAARLVRAELADKHEGELLCDSRLGVRSFDAPEEAAWADWPGAQLSPKRVLGEGLIAASAWQCVAALDAVARGLYPAANVSVTGCNQQAIGARFAKATA